MQVFERDDVAAAMSLEVLYNVTYKGLFDQCSDAVGFDAEGAAYPSNLSSELTLGIRELESQSFPNQDNQCGVAPTFPFGEASGSST